MSVIRKSFVINNDFAKLTKSHVVQLFQPSYNPKLDDEFYVSNLSPAQTPTNYFPLQYYPKATGASASLSNPVETVYNTKNIIGGMFLVTENFLDFINKINGLWQAGTKPEVITPIEYSQDDTGKWNAVSDITDPNRAMAIEAFSGPSGNNASKGLAKFEDAAKNGIEGATTEQVASTSIPELFLRHLYSIDAGKRDIALNFANIFYGIPIDEINVIRNEMNHAENFDSDKFVVSMEDDVLKFDYTTPIKFSKKYEDTVHNTSNKKLYLYFPYITSNALRDLDEDRRTFRDLINVYSGLKTPLNNILTTSLLNVYNKTFNYRAKNNQTNGSVSSLDAGCLGIVQDMPTLTNSIWSTSKNKSVLQAGYTALHISEVGGGGDIQFDHVDKIDYIDSLTIEITVPTVFS